MECKQVVAQLSELIDQELSEQEMREMLTHLASCEKCNKEYLTLYAMVRELNHIKDVPLPQGFEQELREKLIVAKHEMEKENFANVTVLPLLREEKKKKPIWKKYSAIAAVFAVMLISTSTVWFMEQNDILPDATLYGGASKEQDVIVKPDAHQKDAVELEKSKNKESSQDVTLEGEHAQAQQSGQIAKIPKNQPTGQPSMKITQTQQPSQGQTESLVGITGNANAKTNATNAADANNAEQANLPLPQNGTTGFRSVSTEPEYTTESATELVKAYVTSLKNETEKVEIVKTYKAAFDLDTLAYVYQGQSANHDYIFTITGTKDGNPAEQHTITTVSKDGIIVVEDSWVK